jgi:hypothetical protein
MAGDGGGDSPNRINRREALKRTAIATGVAWSAPILTSLRTPAFAQYGVPCEEGCTYVIHLEAPSYACSECEGNICFGNTCGDCAGPSCARITSISQQGSIIRFCTDCTLDPSVFRWEARCPDLSDCTGGNWRIDPSDPRCGIVDHHWIGSCPDHEIEINFSCAAC